MKNTNDNLEPLFTRTVKPFNTQAEDVFHSEGIVTFYTFDYVLYENYKYDAFTDEEGEVLKPGIYRDNQINDVEDENFYTIIVDHEAPLIQGLCEKKIEELNDKYGTNFHPRIITTSYANLIEAGIVEEPSEEVELK